MLLVICIWWVWKWVARVSRKVVRKYWRYINKNSQICGKGALTLSKGPWTPYSDYCCHSQGRRKGHSGCHLRLLSLWLCVVLRTTTPFNTSKGIRICCLLHLSLHCDSLMLYNPISFLIDFKHLFFCPLWCLLHMEFPNRLLKSEYLIWLNLVLI